MYKRQQIIKLWQCCFKDTEAFIQLYFNEKYRDEDALLYEEEGKALSAMLMLPYPMTWCGTVISTSYISGACTHPSVRSKGIMKKLLADAFTHISEQGYILSTLIPAAPWLFDYYRQQGYSTIFDYTLKSYTLSPGKPFDMAKTHVDHYEKLFDQIYTYFSRKTDARACAIQHSSSDFKTILEDLYMSEGRLIIANDKSENISGLMIARPDKNKININELLYDSEKEKEALLQKAADIWQIETAVYKLPPEQDAIPKGMARAINAMQMLTHYASYYPKKKFSIKLTDNQLIKNNNYYIIKNGTCSQASTLQHKPDFEMDIQTFTQALLGYRLETLPESYATVFESGQPFMNLMLDE